MEITTDIKLQLAKLEIDYTEIIEDNTNYVVIETDNDGICLECKEHASICRTFDKVGDDLVESYADSPTSNCCGSGIHIW